MDRTRSRFALSECLVGFARALGLLTVFVLLGVETASAVKPISTGRLGSLALGGYDAVAYLDLDGPKPGSKNFEHRWSGAVWRFSTAENLDRFAAEPERFAPQYGGYCAYAVSRDYTASGDPEIWRIVNDRLYLNYNEGARSLWLEDVPGNVGLADRNWPKLRDKN